MRLFALLFTIIPIASVLCIIGGEEPAPEDMIAPALVFIDHGIETHKDNRYCTGFLVNRWQVVSVAHCCLHKTARTSVRLGSRWAFDFGETHAVVKVRQILGPETRATDNPHWRMCLMKLNRPVSRYQKVSYLILPLITEKPPADRDLVAYGFGSSEIGVDEPTNKLMMLQMPRVDVKACREAYKAPLALNPRNTTKFGCYGYTTNAKKLVRFDAGAPLVDVEHNKVFGMALTSLRLNKTDADFYPVFASSVPVNREDLNEALRSLGDPPFLPLS